MIIIKLNSNKNGRLLSHSKPLWLAMINPLPCMWFWLSDTEKFFRSLSLSLFFPFFFFLFFFGKNSFYISFDDITKGSIRISMCFFFFSLLAERRREVQSAGELCVTCEWCGQTLVGFSCSDNSRDYRGRDWDKRTTGQRYSRR